MTYNQFYVNSIQLLERQEFDIIIRFTNFPRKQTMKKATLILITILLFTLSLVVAYHQGAVPTGEETILHQASLMGARPSAFVYGGMKGVVVSIFSVFFNGFLMLSGGSALIAIIAMALLVEIVLLYPSVSIQLKQKKIHLFHKKLVDRCNNEEVTMKEAEKELNKLYEVNEKIHQRGALLVVAQIALLFSTFWGLKLLIHAPEALYGSWSLLDFSLLTRPDSVWLPVIASLVYFSHALMKMWLRSSEDYISPYQMISAFLFTLVGSGIVFTFAGIFSSALTIYFVTLVTFSTIRYWVVEQHAKEWGSLAQRELMEMLKATTGHKNKFQYFSRVWNHLPVIRLINFNLLEEALSMTLGLLLALSFFGAFHNTDAQTQQKVSRPSAIVQQIDIHPLN